MSRYPVSLEEGAATGSSCTLGQIWIQYNCTKCLHYWMGFKLFDEAVAN